MRLKMPHTFVLLFVLVVAAAIATHFIPAGQYDRVDRGGRKLVDPSTYHSLDPRPAGIGDIFMAYPRGLTEVSVIVFYIFLIGGTFEVINATGAIEALIRQIVRACGGRGGLVIPLLMVLFSLGGGTIGMAEETLPFLPALVLLARQLGYDEITGGAIALVGAGAGFSGAFLNPFTVGVGQAIAGLPAYSGLRYRLLVWTCTTLIAVLYVSYYARRIRRPIDPAAAVGLDDHAQARTSLRQKIVLGVFLSGLGALIFGCQRWSWGIGELSGLFLAVAILCGLSGGLGANTIAEKFLAGAAGISTGALVVGLARGILVVFDRSHVTDSILHAMAGAVQGLPAYASIFGIYGVQVALSYLVPSGSGQAALSLPILAPLADLVGVTRQTSVLAYQFGDGFSNIFTPTSGYFMAGLLMIGVPWPRWARFILPLQILWLIAGLALLLLAHAIHWGPF